MKKNLNYYSHYSDSHRDPAFRYLRSRYDWEGEAKYYALKNIISAAENCMLDISKPFLLGCYADELDFSLDEFKEYLHFLESECMLITRVDNSITVSDLQENLSKVMRDRQNAKRRKAGSSEHSESSAKLFNISDELNNKERKKEINH